MDCCTHITERGTLFKGGSTWPGDWRTTHSRVVQGISYSRLEHYESLSEFHGWIDRAGLDSTGFAALHTIGNTHTWNLSRYDALEVAMGSSDGKLYTVSLEDEGPTAWEATFRAAGGQPASRVIRFQDLMPGIWATERNTKPLDLGNIKQFKILIRNMGEMQEGGFSLNLQGINAVKLPCACTPVQSRILVREREIRSREVAKEKAQEIMRDLKDILAGYMVQGKQGLLVVMDQVNQQMIYWRHRVNRRRIRKGELRI